MKGGTDMNEDMPPWKEKAIWEYDLACVTVIRTKSLDPPNERLHSN
jgi:hypothetical protein